MNKETNSKKPKKKADTSLEKELEQLIEEMDSRNKGIKKIMFNMKNRINKENK